MVHAVPLGRTPAGGARCGSPGPRCGNPGRGGANETVVGGVARRRGELNPGRLEERVTPPVSPRFGDGEFQAAYEPWGHERIGTQQLSPGSPVFARTPCPPRTGGTRTPTPQERWESTDRSRPAPVDSGSRVAASRRFPERVIPRRIS